MNICELNEKLETFVRCELRNFRGLRKMIFLTETGPIGSFDLTVLRNFKQDGNV